MARAMPKETNGAETLQSRLDDGARLDQAALFDLLCRIGAALDAVHQQQRFHGSLTPADIRFLSDGEILIDGWDRDTTPDAMRASCYAAIECYAPVHPQGPWTDIYAVGAIAWRAITGAPPAEVLHRKGNVTLARLAPPGFDLTFLRGIDAALEIAPQRRPQTVGEWLGHFDREPIAVHPVDTSPAAPGPPLAVATPDHSEPKRRWAWPIAATAAGLAAVLGAIWRPPAPETAPQPTPAPATQGATTASPPVAAPAVMPTPSDVATPVVPTPEPAPVAAPVISPAQPQPSIPAPQARPSQPAKPAPDPVPAIIRPAPDPEPPMVGVGEAPRALLARADRRLRRLFDDYARLRARVERSYDDPDIPYTVKREAYREGLRMQAELVELRDVRNRIARTGDFQTANRRYDRFEAAAANLSARMAELRRSF